MAKVDLKSIFYTDDFLFDDKMHNSYYDSQMYTETTLFLDQILDHEYIIDETKDLKKQKIEVNKYLHDLYKYQQFLSSKIKRLKQLKNQL